MITDLRNTDFVSFHIKPSISSETWTWITSKLGLSKAAGTMTADGFVSCVDLGFIRVSNGSRYNEELSPTIEDKTVQVPGADGSYYFGSLYRDKTFSLPIAYDSMTEDQIRAIRLIFAGDRKLWDIYFDEEPYKVYHVKVSNPIQLTYICMDDKISDDASLADTDIAHNHVLNPRTTTTTTTTAQTTNTKRIYKGEGTITLKAITPFATERYKFLSSYSESNKSEWADSSRLKENGNDETFSNGTIRIKNAGDVDCDWTLTYTPGGTDVIQIKIDNNLNCILDINPITLFSGDSKVRVNSKLNLIEGLDSNGKPTGKVYNQYKKDGVFFKIPRGEQTIVVGGYSGLSNVVFEYHFKYF